jgi:hypothetical protein
VRSIEIRAKGPKESDNPSIFHIFVLRNLNSVQDGYRILRLEDAERAAEV